MWPKTEDAKDEGDIYVFLVAMVKPPAMSSVNSISKNFSCLGIIDSQISSLSKAKTSPSDLKK